MSGESNFNVDNTSEITTRIVNSLSENGLEIEGSVVSVHCAGFHGYRTLRRRL